MTNLPDRLPSVNHLALGTQPATIGRKLSEGNFSRRDFFREKTIEHSESKTRHEVEAHAERCTASRSHAALAVLTAELGFSDKSHRLLSVLCGISNGHHIFKITFGELYSQLRKHDPKLRDEKGQLASKASQTVRRYVQALRKDQERTGVVFATLETGTINKDGTHIPSSVDLPLLDYLNEIDRRTKTSPSYSRNSVAIRKAETRKLAAELLRSPGHQTQTKPEGNPMAKIDTMLKQISGMIDSTIRAMKAESYTDEAIRAWLLKSLSENARAIVSTNTAEIQKQEHGAAACDSDSILTPHHGIPLTVSGLENAFDTLPDLQASENPKLSKQASVDNLHSEAISMVDVFGSVGAVQFDLTTTNEQGKKTEFERGLPADHLKSCLPNLLQRCEQANLNVIVRPQLATGAAVRLVQLDDLDRAALEKVQPFAFLTIETSPANFQAWVAIEQASDELVRRFKKGIGADSTASGATRIAGSRNFKPKHAPAYPRIRIAQASLGRTVTVAELDQAALLAPQESEPPRRAHAPIDSQPRMWPSYQRCLADSPKASNHGGPDRSRADFEFCLIAIDRGWPVEVTAQRLMLESTKAEQEGIRYAQHTARNAANVIASRSRYRTVTHERKGSL